MVLSALKMQLKMLRFQKFQTMFIWSWILFMCCGELKAVASTASVQDLNGVTDGSTQLEVESSADTVSSLSFVEPMKNYTKVAGESLKIR